MYCMCFFITARKRSLQRLFFTRVCLSTWGGTCAGTPPGTRGMYTLQTGTPPWAGTPSRQILPPPGAVHAGRYGQQAGGLHPTGMHSCFYSMLLAGKIDDLRFSLRLGRKPIICQDFCRKLHENGRNWTERGRASLVPP